MLISPAYAQAGGALGGGDMLTQFLPLILIFRGLLVLPDQAAAEASQGAPGNDRGRTSRRSGRYRWWDDR